jgi:hypothetical protein
MIMITIIIVINSNMYTGLIEFIYLGYYSHGIRVLSRRTRQRGLDFEEDQIPLFPVEDIECPVFKCGTSGTIATLGPLD